MSRKFSRFRLLVGLRFVKLNQIAIQQMQVLEGDGKAIRPLRV